MALMLCSLLQIYGKGTGKACRKHVQKLNMLQGEREKREERGGGNHPPCDYASTFTAQSVGTRETQVSSQPARSKKRMDEWDFQSKKVKIETNFWRDINRNKS